MKDRIVARKVTRFYVNGKGYPTRYFAARSIAKEELRNKVGEIVGPIRWDYSDIDAQRKAWRNAYAAFFEGGGKAVYKRWLNDRTQEILKEQELENK